MLAVQIASLRQSASSVLGRAELPGAVKSFQRQAGGIDDPVAPGAGWFRAVCRQPVARGLEVRVAGVLHDREVDVVGRRGNPLAQQQLADGFAA